MIAGTHGRSIWILDDLTPLRDLADGLPDSETRLFPPRETLRVLPGLDWSGSVAGTMNYLAGRSGGFTVETTPDGELLRNYLDAGENPPSGAIVTYRLVKEPEEPITLTLRRKDGSEVRTFSSRTADDPPTAKQRRIPAQAGWNRFVWDMRHAPATKIEGTDEVAEKAIEGPIVAPGDFTVTLKTGATELTQPFRIVKPRQLTASQADLDAQEDLLVRIHRSVDRLATTINFMRDLRAQIDGLVKRTKERNGGDKVSAAAEALRDRVLELEKTLVVPDLRPGWADAINEGARLWEKLTGLSAVVALGDYPPTDAAEAVFTDLTKKIERQRAQIDKVLAEDLATFNKQATRAKLGMILAPMMVGD